MRAEAFFGAMRALIIALAIQADIPFCITSFNSRFVVDSLATLPRTFHVSLPAQFMSLGHTQKRTGSRTEHATPGMPINCEASLHFRTGSCRASDLPKRIYEITHCFPRRTGAHCIKIWFITSQCRVFGLSLRHGGCYFRIFFALGEFDLSLLFTA